MSQLRAIIPDQRLSFWLRQRSYLEILFRTNHVLSVDRANHLRSHLLIAMLGSPGTACMVYLLLYSPAIAFELNTWLLISLVPMLIRAFLFFGHRSFSDSELADAKQFLRWYAISCLISGAQYAIGWQTIAPMLSVEGQYIYLLAVIALLFGGLHTYSPHFSSYVTYTTFSVLGAIFVGHFFIPLKIMYADTMIMLVYLLAILFGAGFSLSFAQNNILRRNEAELLHELRVKHEETLLANSAKSRFLAAVSHDLRQPMHAISLYVATIDRILFNDGPDSSRVDQLRSQLERLTESVDYLNEMFNALLDLSRLESGSVTTQLTPTTLQPILDRVDHEFTVLARKIGLHFSIRNHLNPERLVVAEEKSLERVLRNLISNGLRHTSSGGVRLVIRADGSDASFRVIDTGVGISRENHKKIFQDFFQINGLKKVRSEQGHFGNTFGLGLSIADRLARKMEGAIQVNSWRGVGSVFSLKLPIVKGQAVLNSKHTQTLPVFKPFEGELSIVLVEDDPRVLESTREHLGSYGFTVIAAKSRDEAILKLAHSDRVPDLVLSDYRLGNDDGISAIASIRDEFNSQIPGLIITGETDPHHLERIEKSGFRILFKPIKPTYLIHSIQQEIDSHREMSTYKNG